ncbi:MAG: SDR family oxidoreductase [Microbacterium sp.]
MKLDDILADPLARPIAGASMAGRRAVIAGGGISGEFGSIGFATAWLLAREGARVVILDRDADAAARSVAAIESEGGWAAAVVGDISDDADCDRAVREAVGLLGGLDAVVTTVGRGDIDGILDVDRNLWDQIIAVNLTSAWQLIRSASPYFDSGGTIVTTSSGAAGARGPGMPYSVAKAALEQLTVGAAATLAPRGIRVNAIRVGTIWSTFASRAFSPDLRALRSESVALHTEGTVWDIAQAALFLSGDRSRWISGQVLAVDGGGPTPPPPGHREATEQAR